MQVVQEGTSEAAIFGRVLELGRATLSAAAAKSILALDFSDADRDRMRCLLAKAKAKEGKLSPAEENEIDNYERVGHMISLMKSKARRSLKSRDAMRRPKKAH